MSEPKVARLSIRVNGKPLVFIDLDEDDVQLVTRVLLVDENGSVLRDEELQLDESLLQEQGPIEREL